MKERSSNTNFARKSFIFGPVPSRRLGRSLGIDLLPCKMCSFDCVYCECGPTEHLTIEQFSEPSPDVVVSELKKFLQTYPSDFDVITFSGSGEPTLYEPIGDLIDLLKKNFPSHPIAILTNGSLLTNHNVRKSILKADIISPSLDAPDETLFFKINRPHPSLTWDGLIEGLVALRKEYHGNYRLEILLLKGINDSHEHLKALADLARIINPDVVDLTTLTRPGTISALQGLSEKDLLECANFFHNIPCSVVGNYVKKGRELPATIPDDVIDARIIELLIRRPCSLEDLADSLGVSLKTAKSALERIKKNYIINVHRIESKLLYSLSSPLS
ncbi:MAG: radical SAM protein [Thermodesulforhabdaceae bacterium]